MRASAGVTVKATSIDANTARPYEIASGWKNAPDSPPIMNTGIRATTSMSVAYTIALRTSSDASRITGRVDFGDPSRRAWRRRRTMFSTSMMASSTTTPTAMTKPARTMVLSVAPRADSTTRGRHERERDRDHADEGGPPVEEEQEQDGDDQQDAEQQGIAQVADRILDERGRTEDRGVDLDPRERRLEDRERLLDATRHVEGVRPGELLDDQQQALAVIDDRIADERLMPDDDVRDVADRGHPRAVGLDDDFARSWSSATGWTWRHGQSLVRRLDEPARPHRCAVRELEQAGIERIGRRRHHLVEGQPVRRQPFGLHEHVQHRLR